VDAVLNAPKESGVEPIDVPDGYEQIDGRLVEMHVGAKSAWVGGNVFSQLLAFCQQQKLGWVFPSETIYRCFPNRKTARKPDASFVRTGRLPGEIPPDGEIKIPPDLVVEVVSPNDTYYDVARKVKEYLDVGVRLVWVINPDSRETCVHRPGRTTAMVLEGQDLDGEDVVPGFRSPLASCLLPPEHETNGQTEGAEGES
jgi:Uma2 family endonuclease